MALMRVFRRFFLPYQPTPYHPTVS
jgi:hypothetical protein